MRNKLVDLMFDAIEFGALCAFIAAIAVFAGIAADKI